LCRFRAGAKVVDVAAKWAVRAFQAAVDSTPVMVAVFGIEDWIVDERLEVEEADEE
jgi:hypothetical protein